MHKASRPTIFLAIFLLLALALAACSGNDSAEEDAGLPTARGEGFQANAGPNLAVMAGDSIELKASAANGELAGCTWTIVTPVARFSDEDAGRELGGECALTIPGDFTTERTGLWTVELAARSAAGETSTDQVDIRVTPNTVELLILGYAIIFGVGMIFVGSLAWRARSLRREAAALTALINEEDKQL